MNKQHFYYLIFALFVAEVAAIAAHAQSLLAAPVWFWILLGFAANRAARTVSFNAIGAPLRAPFTVTHPDGSGAGDSVDPKDGSGLGELLACPICTGTHAAAAILALYGILPAAGLAVVAMLGTAGISEGIHWVYEVTEWAAHRQREETGKIVRQREAQARAVELDKAIARKYTEDVRRDMESWLYDGRKPWETEWMTSAAKDGQQ